MGAVAALVATLGVASPAAAAPALVVSPPTGLLDGQAVTVTGTGFEPGERVLLTQCIGPVPDWCAMDPPVNTNAALARADDAGAVSATLRLPRILELEGGDESCAHSDCSIVAVAVDAEDAERARTFIDFEETGSAPPPPAPALAISTQEVRADALRTTWTGTGYLPWYLALPVAFDAPPPVSVANAVGAAPGAYVGICRTGGSDWSMCQRFVSPPMPLGSSGTVLRLHQVVPVAGDGTISTTREVPRLWVTQGERIDCAAARCRFQLDQGASASNAVALPWAREWAPWPTAGAFVDAAYAGLVGRAPAAQERGAAVATLTSRSLTGYRLLRQLAARSDGRRLAELSRLYLAALGRAPDAAGLLHWAGVLRRTGSMSQIAATFGRTAEFRRSFGSGTPAQAVTLAYERTLGRTPTAGERDYWVGRLSAGMTRAHMIHHFSRSSEFVGRMGGASEVAAIAVGLAGRAPTADEMILAGPGDHHDPTPVPQRADAVILAILGSDELVEAVG